MFGFRPPFWFQGGHRGMHGQGPFAVIARSGVQLTDEQVEKLAELKGDGMMDFAGKGAEMLPNIREIMRALTKEHIDKEAVRSMHKDMQAKRNQMADQFVERILAAAEILTAEQRKQVRMFMLRQSLGLGKECEDEEHPRRGPGDLGPGDRRPPR